jgi:iron complex outermembrane receptor protein
MIGSRARISLAVASAVAAMSCALPVAAQQPSSQSLERVEVTGSSIRRTDAETALPVTVLRVEELRKLGITTAEQAVQ